MKILKEGKRQLWWIGKLGTCKHCKTQVQLEAGDKVKDTFGSNAAVISVECPTCKSEIHFNPNSPDAEDHDCIWKERARRHGCDVENGDPDCG